MLANFLHLQTSCVWFWKIFFFGVKDCPLSSKLKIMAIEHRDQSRCWCRCCAWQPNCLLKNWTTSCLMVISNNNGTSYMYLESVLIYHLYGLKKKCGLVCFCCWYKLNDHSPSLILVYLLSLTLFLAVTVFNPWSIMYKTVLYF